MNIEFIRVLDYGAGNLIIEAKIEDKEMTLIKPLMAQDLIDSVKIDAIDGVENGNS